MLKPKNSKDWRYWEWQMNLLIATIANNGRDLKKRLSCAIYLHLFTEDALESINLEWDFYHREEDEDSDGGTI